MKNTKVTLLVLFCFLLTGGYSSDFIWRITKNGSPLQFFLVGTQHSPTLSDFHPEIMGVIQHFKPKYVLSENSVPEEVKFSQTPFYYRYMVMTYHKAFLKCIGFNEHTYKNIDISSKIPCNYDEKFKLKNNSSKEFFRLFVELLWDARGRKESIAEIEHLANSYSAHGAFSEMESMALRAGLERTEYGHNDKTVDYYMSVDNFVLNKANKKKRVRRKVILGAKTLWGFDKDQTTQGMDLLIAGDMFTSYGEAVKEFNFDELLQAVVEQNQIATPFQQVKNQLLNESFQGLNSDDFTEYTEIYIQFVRESYFFTMFEEDNYFSGSEKYFNLIKESISETELTCDDFYLEMNFKRNSLWVDRINEFFTQYHNWEEPGHNISILGAGGMAHMVGKHGVLHKLLTENSGYTVERVYLNRNAKGEVAFNFGKMTKDMVADYCND